MVEDARAEQAVRHLRPVRCRGAQELFLTARRDRRRAHRELPARHAGALGPRPGRAARGQPAAGDRPGDGLRPVRPVLAAGRVRDAGRGDERLRGASPASRTGRRPCRRSGSPTAIAALATAFAVMTALRDRDVTGRGPGHRPGDHRADPDDARPADHRVRPTRLSSSRGPATARSTTRRATSTRPPTGTGSPSRLQLAVDRRAGDAAGRPPRPDRRAVVRHRARPGRARRRARRGGRPPGSPGATRDEVLAAFERGARRRSRRSTTSQDVMRRPAVRARWARSRPWTTTNSARCGCRTCMFRLSGDPGRSAGRARRSARTTDEVYGALGLPDADEIAGFVANGESPRCNAPFLTWLYVPGDRPQVIAKALTSPAATWSSWTWRTRSHRRPEGVRPRVRRRSSGSRRDGTPVDPRQRSRLRRR